MFSALIKGTNSELAFSHERFDLVTQTKDKRQTPICSNEVDFLTMNLLRAACCLSISCDLSSLWRVDEIFTYYALARDAFIDSKKQVLQPP